MTDDEFTDALADNDPVETATSEEYIELLGDDLTPEQVAQAKWHWEEVVRLDYQEWSGGSLPTKSGQISAYIEDAGSWFDESEVRAVLTACIP